MTSFGDTTEKLNVYLPWELKNSAGNALDIAARRLAFEEWVSRMLVRHCLWAKDGPEGSDTWVAKVVSPNKITSVHEFVAASKAPRESWYTEWNDGPGPKNGLRLRDQGPLNDLVILAEAELKTLGTGSSRSVAPSDPAASQDIILAMALANKGAKELGIDVSMFPGLNQKVAESKRIRREQLQNLITKVNLESLYDEVLPGEKVMKALDSGLSGGSEHVAANINDLVELFDEWVPQQEGDWGGDDDERSKKNKPPKGEAFGLSHHLLKLLTWMVALRLREQVDEAHVYNMLYFVLKAYRQEGNRDVGLHYAQGLFNRLHKKSWWTSVGTLKTALSEPSKEVLESFRLTYPRVQKVVPQPASKGSPKG